jgi:hypothetical protein
VLDEPNGQLQNNSSSNNKNNENKNNNSLIIVGHPVVLYVQNKMLTSIKCNKLFSSHNGTVKFSACVRKY